MTWRLRIVLAVGLAMLGWQTVEALPPVPAYVEKHYSASPQYAKFVETFKALESKCDTCHKPGADKKAKGHGLNDFGEAIHKNFKHRDFTAAHKLAKDNPAEAAKALQIIVDALNKAETQKNAQGQAYGALLKSGTLPGKN
jgi:hypothetical protein